MYEQFYWTIIFSTNEINYFEWLKKTGKMVCSQTMNERNEKCGTCSSLMEPVVKEKFP